MNQNILNHLWKNTEKISPCLFYPAIIQMGESVKDVLTDGKKQAEVFQYIEKSYPSPIIIRMSELWCEAASFGVELSMAERDFPHLGTPVLKTPADYESLQVPEVRNEIITPMIEAVSIAAPALSKPIVAGITGPYTLASVICDPTEVMMSCMMEPDEAKGLMEKVTSFLVDYALAYKNAGAAGIIIAEPSITMIAPDTAEEFSNYYIKKIIDAVQDDSFFVIYHNCGAVNPHLDVILSLPADAFHFGSDVDLNLALDKADPSRYVMGNVEPRWFLQKNAPAINEKVKELKVLADLHENFIISTGCDLSPAAKAENIDAMFALE
ncbi:MAG: uroporphyrinogen decarboxylase family protein [Lachnospiraceae bacterium]|nr:uroporphyrinogen decarboxylase family protein [Lachnospiraceae bacterium]